MHDVILIEDDAAVREAYQDMLELSGLAVAGFPSLSAARRHVTRASAAVVLSDVRMADDDGFAVLEAVRSVDPEMPVILISGHADVSMATRAIRSGAFDFVEKPADPAYVIELVRRAHAHRALVLSHRALSRSVAPAAIEQRILGISPAIVRLRETIAALAGVDVSILIQGETGTGKELVARCLHDFSPRAAAPFVAINCAALPPTMLESELFGHEAGAFTGAREKRIGKIEHANRGTLFLDEIESMPLDAQARLLRVLQERQLERIGSNRLISLDIRVVAATKADLFQLARGGHFREDLAYRLAVVPLAIPSLRARGEAEIAFLYGHFFMEVSARLGQKVTQLRDVEAVQRHAWPGNVRELRNAAERAALGFSPLGDAVPDGRNGQFGGQGRSLAERMARHEKRELEAVLTLGRKLQDTAADLGISRKTLYLKMREHGLLAADGDNENGS